MIATLLLCLAPALAAAQSAGLKPVLAAAGAAPAKPAAPAAPAIIPGSPLATLTGASPAAPAAAPAPFGARRIGFVISTAIGTDALRALQQFSSATARAVSLVPIQDWLAKTNASPYRRGQAKAVLLALLIAVLPAILADALLRLLLRRPAALCAQWAARRNAPGAAGRKAAAPPGWGRRFGFAALRALLALVPAAGFVLCSLMLLTSGAVTERAALLAATGTGNAYLICRLAQELARLLINPGAAPLRLIPMPDGRALALMRWLLTVLTTLFLTAAVVSCAAALGMARDGVQVLIRYAALIVHLEAAYGIWQCRALVGGWIAGPQQPGTSALAWLRGHVGRWWHYVAIFYLMALWLGWVAGVHDAFAVLLRSVLVVMGALAAGAIAWKGSAALLERLLAAPEGDAPAASPRRLALRARAGVYRPLFRFLLRAGIALAVLLFILQGWGVDALDWLGGNPISHALLSALGSILATGAVALGLWEGGNFFLQRRIDDLTDAGFKRRAARLSTLAPILRGAAGTLIFVVALLVCLSRIGVNTTGLLAVSSIAGIAVGFGSQKLVQDVITGLFMLLEDAVQVGDAVTLAGMSGTVERLSIRTIHLRGGDGALNIIPFSAVTTITNATRDFSNAQLSITVGYDEDIDHVCAVLTDIGEAMRAEPVWETLIRADLQIFGLDEFDERGLAISAQIRTAPGQHYAVRREFYKRVQQRFRAEGIFMPHQQNVLKLEMPPGEKF